MKIAVGTDYAHTYCLSEMYNQEYVIYQPSIEVDEKTLARWKSVMDQYTEIQNEIAAVCKQQGVNV